MGTCTDAPWSQRTLHTAGEHPRTAWSTPLRTPVAISIFSTPPRACGALNKPSRNPAQTARAQTHARAADLLARAPPESRPASLVAGRGACKPRVQAVSGRCTPLVRATHVRSHRFRPKRHLLYEHVFCSLAASTLVQRARTALSLTRSFLLLEDDDPVDWEVDRVERRIDEEPAWARAHRSQLRGRRAVPGLVRRTGQAAPPPQPCLSPIVNDAAGSNRDYRRVSETSCQPVQRVPSQRVPSQLPSQRVPAPRGPVQRGSRMTTGSSRLAIDL